MRRTFIQAGIFALFVFMIGIMVGVFLDNYRIGSIRSALSEADINWNDARLLNAYLDQFGTDYCDIAFEQNLVFNEKIYKEGREIEKKISSNMFTPEIEQEWRRYTLLQTQFWLNSVELKKRCGFDYHTVVHLSRQKDISTTEEIDNKVQSSVLLDLKEKCGRKIMLIPLTADSDLIIIDTILKQFNITKYPTIVIDENSVFQGLTHKEELENMLDC